MPSVAVIGTRGYPSYYGGFETAVRKLSPFLSDRGWDVTVYGRPGATKPEDPTRDLRVASQITRGLETQKLSTLSYGFTSSIDAARSRPDVALVMNVANGFYLPALRARGIPTLVNVDGIEWERAKWSPLAKRVFLLGARITAQSATRLVFDAEAIGRYWHERFNVDGVFIPYGGDVPDQLRVPLGLNHRSYVLIVARLVPENTVPEFFEIVPQIAARHPVVIVGTSGYGGELDGLARRLASENAGVNWLRHVSDDELLLALWQHAGVYFHGHSVGGTNPALVQAMAAGAPIVARNTIYNREVLGEAGVYTDSEPKTILETLLNFMAHPSAREHASLSNSARAKMYYSWNRVCGAYEHELRNLTSR